jgi:6-pyruvoyl-tetrahydropterin synthase
MLNLEKGLFMSETELRKKLHEAIDKADHRLLNMVNALMEAYGDESVIIGYAVDGAPITRKDLKQRVEKAEVEIAKGDYLSHEDLEKESANW